MSGCHAHSLLTGYHRPPMDPNFSPPIRESSVVGGHQGRNEAYIYNLTFPFRNYTQYSYPQSSTMQPATLFDQQFQGPRLGCYCHPVQWGSPGFIAPSLAQYNTAGGVYGYQYAAQPLVQLTHPISPVTQQPYPHAQNANTRHYGRGAMDQEVSQRVELSQRRRSRTLSDADRPCPRVFEGSKKASWNTSLAHLPEISRLTSGQMDSYSGVRRRNESNSRGLSASIPPKSGMPQTRPRSPPTGMRYPCARLGPADYQQIQPLRNLGFTNTNTSHGRYNVHHRFGPQSEARFMNWTRNQSVYATAPTAGRLSPSIFQLNPEALEFSLTDHKPLAIVPEAEGEAERMNSDNEYMGFIISSDPGTFYLAPKANQTFSNLQNYARDDSQNSMKENPVGIPNSVRSEEVVEVSANEVTTSTDIPGCETRPDGVEITAHKGESLPEEIGPLGNSTEATQQEPSALRIEAVVPAPESLVLESPVLDKPADIVGLGELINESVPSISPREEGVKETADKTKQPILQNLTTEDPDKGITKAGRGNQGDGLPTLISGNSEAIPAPFRNYRDALLGKSSSETVIVKPVKPTDLTPVMKTTGDNLKGVQTSGVGTSLRKFFLRPIPPSVDYDTLLKNIHEGILEDVLIVKSNQTIRGPKPIKKDNFAHLSFYSEDAAERFWIRVNGNRPDNTHPSHGVMMVNDHIVSVNWRNKDQVPPSPALANAVERFGATRYLIVTFKQDSWKSGNQKISQNRGPSAEAKEKRLKLLRDDLMKWRNTPSLKGLKLQRVESLNDLGCDSLVILIATTSIMTAITLKKRFENDIWYRPRCTVRYSEDECARISQDLKVEPAQEAPLAMKFSGSSIPNQSLPEKEKPLVDTTEVVISEAAGEETKPICEKPKPVTPNICTVGTGRQDASAKPKNMVRKPVVADKNINIQKNGFKAPASQQPVIQTLKKIIEGNNSGLKTTPPKLDPAERKQPPLPGVESSKPMLNGSV